MKILVLIKTFFDLQLFRDWAREYCEIIEKFFKTLIKIRTGFHGLFVFQMDIYLYLFLKLWIFFCFVFTWSIVGRGILCLLSFVWSYYIIWHIPSDADKNTLIDISHTYNYLCIMHVFFPDLLLSAKLGCVLYTGTKY